MSLRKRLGRAPLRLIVPVLVTVRWRRSSSLIAIGIARATNGGAPTHSESTAERGLRSAELF